MEELGVVITKSAAAHVIALPPVSRQVFVGQREPALDQAAQEICSTATKVSQRPIAWPISYGI